MLSIAAKRISRFLSLTLSTLVLVGCFGTGDGPTPIAGTPAPPPPPPPPAGLCDPIFNFEDACGAVTFTNFEGGDASIFDNPDMSGLNTSDKVARMLKFPVVGGGTFGGTQLALPSGFDFSAGEAFTMKVWSSRSVPVLFKFEGLNEERSLDHSGSGTWEEVCYDFTGTTGGPAATGLTVIFDITRMGATDTDPDNWTFFFDDITQVASCGGGGGTPIALPVTFDDATVDYELTDFGGAATTLVADPTDATNMVASTDKFAGAESWAGTTVADASGFGAIPFSATETTMTLRVYSPDAGIPVRLKVEDVTDDTISVETEATTTAAGAWETLTFDFSSEVGGTAALNLANTYDKASVFFNFGTDGNTAGDKTYLWEDLAFVTGGGSGSTSTDFEGGSYTFSDFGGGVAAVVANPDASGINVSAQVAQMQKFAGDPWGGSTLDLGGSVDLAAGDSYTMKVRALRSVEVTFKLETGGQETIATHTGSGTWEELCFDFTGVAATVTGITIIFDNGTPGDAANLPDDWTFQFDDIQQITGSCPTTGPSFSTITFDDPTVTYTLTDFGGNGSVVTNDPAGGTNMAVQADKSDTAQTWAGTTVSTEANDAVPTIPLDASNTTMTVRVYSPDVGIPVRLKIEDASNGAISVETEAATTVVSTWETLTFDFANQAAGTAAFDEANTYNKISIFFNFGTDGATAGAKTYYFDDIAMGAPAAAGITLPVTFEDGDAAFYELTDFGGAATTLVADPGNASNTVASSDKFAGSQTWAGTTVADTTGFGALPFSATDTTMTLRVYSPDAGIPVRLKVEDITDGNISVETEATTTVANAWETLTFDFSSQAAGTAALDLMNTYDKASVFFNFGTDGNTAGDKTYLWEDLTFVTGGGSGGTGGELAVNGDFETGDLTGWEFFDSSNSGNGGTISVTSPGAAGTFAGNLNITAPGNPTLKQSNLAAGQLTPNQVVTVTFDWKGTDANGGVANIVLFSELTGGGVSDTFTIFDGPGFPADWTTVGPLNITTGNDVSGGVTLQIAAICGGAAGCISDVSIDNVSITVP